MSGAKLKTTKIDSARRQLDCAIQLWFFDKDDVSTYTLAGAAYQIIHDINKKRGSLHTLLYDSEIIKDEYRAEFVALIKKPTNFFKHADKDPEGTIEFAPIMSLVFMIFSIFGLQVLREPLSDMASALVVWLSIHKPEYVSENYRRLLAGHIPIERLAQLRILKKREFLEACLEAAAATRSRGAV